MPVLHATSVSIFAVRCRSWRHAPTKNPRPRMKTTGVAMIHSTYPAMRCGSSTSAATSSSDSAAAQMVRRRSERMCAACAASASAAACSGSSHIISYPASRTASRSCLGVQASLSYSTVTSEAAKFTAALRTPFVCAMVFSTRVAQAAQLIPVTGNIRRHSLSFVMIWSSVVLCDKGSGGGCRRCYGIVDSFFRFFSDFSMNIILPAQILLCCRF